MIQRHEIESEKTSQVAIDAPELLVSVRTLAEALDAVAGGADIIDVKEPANGPLGRADRATIIEIADALRDRQVYRVTAALGDLSEWEAEAAKWPAFSHPIWRGKVGFAGEVDSNDWPARFERLQTKACFQSIVPVAYADAGRADAPSIDEVIEAAIGTAAPALVIDTFVKDGRSVFEFLPPTRIAEVATRCHELGIRVVLAGSLAAADIDRLCGIEPAIGVVAVRGAACIGGRRTARVAREQVHQLKRSLHAAIQRKQVRRYAVESDRERATHVEHQDVKPASETPRFTT